MNTDVWTLVESRLDGGSVVHDIGHVKRVTALSGWFCERMGGSEEDVDDAVVAGMLHDIVRPAADVDHAKKSAIEARKILESLGREGIGRIVSAIRQHSTPSVKQDMVAQSVFCADKIGEQFGAYGALRACVWTGELGGDFETLRKMLSKKIKLFTPDMFSPLEELAVKQMGTRKRFLDETDTLHGLTKTLIKLRNSKVGLEASLRQVGAGSYVKEALAYIGDPVGFMSKRFNLKPRQKHR